MKKLVIYPLVLCLLILSCKKEESVKAVGTSGKKYAVKFTTSGFVPTVEKLSATQSSLPKSISTTPCEVESIGEIFYMVYDSAGEEIHRFVQQRNGRTNKYSSDRDHQQFNWPFGTITDSLPAGDYTIVALAGRGGNFIVNWPSPAEESPHFRNLNTAYFLYWSIQGDLSKATDTFYGKHTFSAGNEGNEQELTLDRIVGQIVIRLTDQIPANAHYFVFDYLGESTGLHFNDLAPVDSTHDELYPHPIAITAAGRAKPGYEHRMFICNTTDSIDVIIKCYDRAGELIAVKAAPYTRVYKNKRTILTGSLFTPTPDKSFKITVNDQWDPEEDNIGF